MTLISVVTPCYNEEGNVQRVYEEVKRIFDTLGTYRYEHIFIDNASQDKTVAILKQLAAHDPNVKIIVNNRNFGPLRSPYYGLLQAYGDAVISVVADLQDPPECIPEFLHRWENGEKLVLGIKTNSAESSLFFSFRSLYYKCLNKISDIKLLNHATGFGLYDKQVIQALRQLDEPYPYLRGLLSELGFPVSEVPYFQPARFKGVSKGKFFVMYDWAMLGITSHSKIPLRMATISGFVLSVLSLVTSLFYLVYKLVFWQEFALGTAPLVIGMFFFASVQLFFIGILGEYIGAIHTQILKRPLVTEKERINFEPAPARQVSEKKYATAI